MQRFLIAAACLIVALPGYAQTIGVVPVGRMLEHGNPTCSDSTAPTWPALPKAIVVCSDGTIYTGNGTSWDKAGGGSSFDQSLNTTDSPTFGGVTVTGNISATGSGVNVLGPTNPVWDGIAKALDITGVLINYNATGAYDAVLIQATSSDTVDGYMAGLDIEAASPSNAGNHTYISGGYFQAQHNGSGTLTELYGQQGYALNNAAGTVTKGAGVFGNMQAVSSGTITSAAGLMGRLFLDGSSAVITKGSGVFIETPSAGGGAALSQIADNAAFRADDQSGPTASYFLYYNGPTNKKYWVDSDGGITAQALKCPSGQTAPLSVNDTGKIVKGSCS